MVQSYEFITADDGVADWNRNKSLDDDGFVFVQTEKFYLAPKTRLKTITLRLLVLYTLLLIVKLNS